MVRTKTQQDKNNNIRRMITMDATTGTVPVTLVSGVGYQGNGSGYGYGVGLI